MEMSYLVRKYKFLCIFASVTSALFVILFLNAGVGSAVRLGSTKFPDPAAANGAGNHPLFLTIGAGEFESRGAGAMISSLDPGEVTVRVEDAYFCNNRNVYAHNPIDLPKSGPASFSTRYTVNPVDKETFRYKTPEKIQKLTGFTEVCGLTNYIDLTFNMTKDDFNPTYQKYIVVFGAAKEPGLNPYYGGAEPGATENSFRIELFTSTNMRELKAYPLVTGALGPNVDTLSFSNRDRPADSVAGFQLDFVPDQCAVPAEYETYLQFEDTDNITKIPSQFVNGKELFYIRKQGNFQGGFDGRGSAGKPFGNVTTPFLTIDVEESSVSGNSFQDSYVYIYNNGVAEVPTDQSPLGIPKRPYVVSGGDGENELSLRGYVKMYSGKKYRVKLAGLTWKNAISYRSNIRHEQIFERRICRPPVNPTCSITETPVASSATKKAKVKVKFDTRGGGIVGGWHTGNGNGSGIHIAVTSLNGPPSTWDKTGNFGGIGPDKQAAYIARPEGLVGVTKYVFNFNGDRYDRYFINDNHVKPFEVTLDIEVRDNSDDLVIRLYNANTNEWLPYDSSCQTPVDTILDGDGIGFIDACKLDSNGNTVIYGWAYDDNNTTGTTASKQIKPQVDININGTKNNSTPIDTNIAYRKAVIETYLDNEDYGKNARDGFYGFEYKISGLVQDSNYSISGSVNPVKAGDNPSIMQIIKRQVLDAETTNAGRVTFGTSATQPADSTSAFIPQECLPPNAPPSGEISASCAENFGLTTGTVTVKYKNLKDVNNDSLTLTLTKADGSTITKTVTANGAGVNGSFDSYTVARDDIEYTVSATAKDADNAAEPMGTATYTCELPDDPVVKIVPNVAGEARCEILKFVIEDSEGFRYDAELYESNIASGDVRRENIATDSEQKFTEVRLWKDFNQKSFKVKATNRSFTSVQADSNPVIVGPCLKISCGNFSVVTTASEPNVPFDATFTFKQSERIGPKGQNNKTARVVMDSPPSYTRGDGDMYKAKTGEDNAIVPNLGADLFTPAYRNNITPTETGVFDIKFTITGLNPATLICGDGGEYKSIISNRPYAKLFGNDIFAGGGFGKTCTASSTPAAIGYMSHQDGFFKGASSELAVFAASRINGVRPGATSNAIPTGGLAELTRLAFANSGSGVTVNPNNYDFGGSFGQAICTEDWWADSPNGTVVDVGVGSPKLDISDYNGKKEKIYIDPGNQPLRLFADSKIADGTRVTVYVDGDVVLSPGSGQDSITYANTNWNSQKKIPSVSIIALGNIFVDHRIKALDGVFVAQPDIDNLTTPTGEIHTCYDAANLKNLVTKYSTEKAKVQAFLASNCANKLTVTGAFVADRVELLRTNGTVSDAKDTSAERRGNTANIAEVFRFNPLTYISGGKGTPGSRTASVEYESILSLPPSF